MLPNGTKKTLCQSLVQSHIDYVISSWYAAMSQKAKTKLQFIQNKMVRFILDLGPRTHITTKHISDLNILKIPGRVQQLRLNISHKIYYNQAPTYLQTNFKKIVTEDNTLEAPTGTLLSQMSKGQKVTHFTSTQ